MKLKTFIPLEALKEEKADKDYDGDGEVESSEDEYLGARDKAIKKAMKKEEKADKDYDGDGEVESSEDEYLGSRDKAIKKAMKSMKEASEYLEQYLKEIEG